MRRALLTGLATFVVACAAAESPAPTPAPDMAPVPAAPAPVAEPEIETETPVQVIAPTCDGVLVQGGLVICSAEPGSTFTVAGTKLTVSEMGTAQFGLSTRAPSVVGWSHDSGAFGDLQIAERQDEYREISGFDCDKVDARSAEQKAHASRSWVKKQDSFASFNP
ncbi:MAG: hypothetical protein P1U60_12660, partial [Hyphomonas sp.]|nr:hypothetical protein [Hyphomonas sp.]